MVVILEAPIREWFCPNCGLHDQTREARPHSRFHTCPTLRGLSAPMLPAGMDAKVTAHARDDYVNGELVQTDDEGKPVMAVRTERADGSSDVIVFAPTARAEGETRGLVR